MDETKILLIDDNENFHELFLSLEGARSFDVIPVTSPEKGLEVLKEQSIDLIISDVQMPGMTGTDLFREVQDLYPHIPVILVTAFGSTEEAIQAVKEGAFHYFEKPIEDKLDLFWATVREALAKRDMQLELALLRKQRSLQLKTPGTIIGQSKGIREVMESIEQIAPLPVTALIFGETGTGKELVAQAIYNLSDRRDKPFFPVNCNEFAPGVLESELFGHEKGAFTGAVNRKIGLFDVAHKGVLFLDEIAGAPPFFQSKLLRVLETKKFMRVGGTTPIYSDFRLIVATNRDLEKEVAEGRFRQDLFYRINVCTIEIPPLRERKEDIPLIAEFYLKKLAEAYGRSATDISTNAMLRLREYDWPGNVRELTNVIERAVITCPGPVITTQHLPFGTGEDERVSDFNLKGVEKYFIRLALKRTKNNKTKAAELLGISRKTLTEKVKKFGTDGKGGM
ncbi:MAG: sigma-54-dependent Fis family transcriptional regulator [Deltaproteobacteria bacterium]|nr:sigma-54-dependent Fis family transcriptional regulator [Deltaproteobacteria bacterium]